MMFVNLRRVLRLSGLLMCIATASGCQSLPSGSTAGDLAKAMPGEHAQARYAYIVEALEVLNSAMAKETVILPELSLDPALVARLSPKSSTDKEQNSSIIKRLAEQQLIGKGPFQLVKVDTTNGRIEYRSLNAGHHVSMRVRPLSASDKQTAQSFVLTGMFGQVSLATLLAEQSNRADTTRGNTFTASARLSVSRHAGQNDRERLGYFNALPAIERDRADILGLRALLLARQKENKKSSNLVQTGIIRYSKMPLFYTIASVLFERSDPSSNTAVQGLSEIMQKRFRASQIKRSREFVDDFLGKDASKASNDVGA